MTRSELIKKISRKAGVPDSDVKLFFEILLKRLSSVLKIGQAAFIKELGYFFLLKGKINKSRMNFIDEDVPDSYIDFILFSLNKNLQSSIQEGLIFNVPTSEEDDFHPVDSYFSLSIGKPLIPLRGVSSDEFYVPTGGYELRRLIESKVEKIILESEILSAYENNPPQIILTSQAFSSTRISLELNEPELKLDEEIPDSFIESGEIKKDDTLRIEHVAWDFGIDFSEEINIQTDNANETFQESNKSEKEEEHSFETSDNSVSEFEIEKTLQEIIAENEEKVNLMEEKDVNAESVIENEPAMKEESHTEEPISLKIKEQQSDVVEIDFLSDNNVPEEKTETPTVEIFPSTEEKDKETKIDFLKDEEFQELESEQENVSSPEFQAPETPEEKFEVVNESLKLNEEEKLSLEQDNSGKSRKEDFNEQTELKKIREELYSYQPKKSRVPLLIVLIGTIVIISMLYFYITQIKNITTKPEQKTLSLNTQNATIVERSFEVPVYYPYPKKLSEETEITKQTEVPVDETKSTPIESEQKELKSVDKKEDLKKNVTIPDNVVQKQNQITFSPTQSQNYERVGANLFKYGDHYVVQVAAFRSKSIADNEAAKLRNKGYNAFVERAEFQDGSVWFRVRVGNFPTLREAQEFQSRIKL